MATHAFFEDVDPIKLEARSIEAPFTPTISRARTGLDRRATASRHELFAHTHAIRPCTPCACDALRARRPDVQRV
jgi:hypothetical protein